MWNNIKNYFANTNWLAILLGLVAQTLFVFVVWGLLFAGVFGLVVPGIIRFVVDIGVFMVVYVWAATNWPLRGQQ